MLERARLIDLTNHWATGTMKTYSSKYRILRAFEHDLDLSVLDVTPISAPPNGPAIKLMWAQERYALYPARWRRNQKEASETVKFGTIRALRSAASHHWVWDLLHTRPHRLTTGHKNKPIVVDGCSPTDELAFTFFADGMKRRLGDHSKPAVPLLDCHVRWMDRYFEDLFKAATSTMLKRDVCCAAVTNLAAWLGWLRAMETFSIKWGDLERVTPAEGPTLGLPAGIGVVTGKLLPQTKSSQAAQADMVFAYTTASGLSLGTWLDRLERCLDPIQCTPESFVIAHADGRPWTSHFFRYKYLYPLLSLQRAAGDPYLSRYDESPGMGLIAAFWSFNVYRRGARLQVAKKRPNTVRKATAAEVIEHGRWRVSRGSLDMPTAYLEWPTADRVCLTFFCM
jgi:hypothetical protein